MKYDFHDVSTWICKMWRSWSVLRERDNWTDDLHFNKQLGLRRGLVQHHTGGSVDTGIFNVHSWMIKAGGEVEVEKRTGSSSSGGGSSSSSSSNSCSANFSYVYYITNRLTKMRNKIIGTSRYPRGSTTDTRLKPSNQDRCMHVCPPFRRCLVKAEALRWDNSNMGNHKTKYC
jgi:hypothetical protein